MKRLFLGWFIITAVPAYAGIGQIVNHFYQICEDIQYRTLYYKPYAVTAGLGYIGILKPNVALYSSTCALVYALYAWKSGLNEIKALKRKYTRRSKPVNHWQDQSLQAEPFLFSRWRQQDDQAGDGFYWPTAWWLQNDEYNAQRKFLQDLYAGVIRVYEGGKVLENPTPQHVMHAINQELKMIQDDKKILKKYTDIYRSVKQPEEFKPNLSLARAFLWPNYNRASRLYVDMVIMINRLEVLRTLVAKMLSGVAGNGWPCCY
jgi:hypothetical protein